MNHILFSTFHQNEKRIKVLKIEGKILLNKKIVVSYLNFVFHIAVKTKCYDKILNFVFNSLKTRNFTSGTRIG